MAAKLQCEICGGKLIGRPGGIFECDSCGMEYSVAWAKEKIQENTGTVKVEGTVEVTGKVKIDGPVTVDSGINKETLLRRGTMALEDSNWELAESCFNQVLNCDIECGEAYLGLSMVEARAKDREEYAKKFTGRGNKKLSSSNHVLRARKFSKELDIWFDTLDVHVDEGQSKFEINDKCIGCTKCARHCPENAISGLVRHQHEIDPVKCTMCGICKNLCPVGAIKEI